MVEQESKDRIVTVNISKNKISNIMVTEQADLNEKKHTTSNFRFNLKRTDNTMRKCELCEIVRKGKYYQDITMFICDHCFENKGLVHPKLLD